MNALLSTCLGLFLTIASVHAAKIKKESPGEATKGKVFEWTSGKGIDYQFIIPRSYDAKKGTNLTFILHGSNLSRTWGFANHTAGEFRPDDIVVVPDGTTSNSNGGFNFLGKDADVARFEGLHNEIKDFFKINSTFLYGHSQGSFFALHYAGAKPETVQGVLAHASGVWNWSTLTPKAHHQAIVFMHGTKDPVVPYGNSRGGLSVFKKRGYPMVRLRSLEGWNHWPAENNGTIPHASQQLAWIEGMTTNDSERLAEVFIMLGSAKDKTQHDFAAFYQVAKRVEGEQSFPAGARKAATRAIANIEALAQNHAKALSKIDPTISLEDKAPDWIGHLPMFLRNFEDTPAAKSLQEKWAETLEDHKKASSEHLGSYYQSAKAGDKKEAFEAGLNALSSAYLSIDVSSNDFLGGMKKLNDSAKDLGIDRDESKAFKSLMGNFEKAQSEGRKAFESLNKRAKL